MGDGRDPALKVAIQAAIALLCVGALALIVMIVAGADGDGVGAKALGTALTVVFFLLTATAGASLVAGRADLAWCGFLTVVLSAAALVGSVVAIWGAFKGQTHSDDWGRAIGIAGILALAGAHASLLLRPSYRDTTRSLRRLRNATLVLLAVLAAFVVYAIVNSGSDIDGKLVAVVAILYALCAVVLPLARRGAQVVGPEPPSQVSPIDLLVEHGFVVVGEGPEAAAGVTLRHDDGTLIEITSPSWE